MSDSPGFNASIESFSFRIISFTHKVSNRTGFMIIDSPIRNPPLSFCPPYVEKHSAWRGEAFINRYVVKSEISHIVKSLELGFWIFDVPIRNPPLSVLSPSVEKLYIWMGEEADRKSNIENLIHR